jgi:hypothetical protein
MLRVEKKINTIPFQISTAHNPYKIQCVMRIIVKVQLYQFGGG